MARLLTAGAEWNDATADGITGGTGLTISSANPRTGTYHFRNTSSGTFWTKAISGALATTYYARVAAYFSVLPTAGSLYGVVGFLDAGVTYNVTLRIHDDGTVDINAGGAGVVASTAAGAVSAGTYYVFELALLIGTGSVDYAEGRINGVSFGSASALSISDNAPATFRFTNVASACTFDSDDVALNDSTGAAQNSWPGTGKIVLLSPISDSAVGTGWTLGTGTAISAGAGSTAVKNKPPLGVADLTAGSDTKQIRNASSNANVNYDANLATYTSAGVGSSDTVNVLVPMVATAAPVVTSAKAGTYGISSNPAITNVALGAGGTAGAFWSGVAGGTYPTGWKWSFGTTTYAPTVTLGSSPVARITQVTASTRIADVCAMGMYVDYTPAATATPPKPTVVAQAVKRASIW